MADYNPTIIKIR